MIEAVLTAEGERTRLVVEERGLPLDVLYKYGAGWHAHIEDLAATWPEANPSGRRAGSAPRSRRTLVPRTERRCNSH